MGYVAVVVNYLKNAHCCSLANSLAQQCLKPDLLVIVDNSGQLNADYFANDLPFKLIIVTPGYNTGYSVGANLGVSLAISLRPEGLILLLSPDILFPNADTVDKLYLAYSQTASLHFLGCSQINPDGSAEPVARAFPSLLAQVSRKVPLLSLIFPQFLASYISSYDCSFDSDSVPMSVPWLQSSLLVFSPDCWRIVGGFDPRYFVFMADVELGHQSRTFGIPILLDRRVFVSADGVRASAGGMRALLFSKVGRIHVKDALKYYFKRLIRKFAMNRSLSL